MTGPVRTKDEKTKASNPQTIPRPPNAWIIYRSHKVKELPPDASRAQADVSKIISTMWRQEPDHVKLEYERMADAKKAEHQVKYPDYRFQPMKKEVKEQLREQKKLEKERSRAAKKSKSAASSDPPPSSTPPPPVASSSAPAMPPPIVYATPYGMPPGYTVMQMPYYMSSYISGEARFGPAGPSPPLSAASSPAETVSSPEPQPTSEELPVPSTSASNAHLPPTPESQYTTTSQPFPASAICTPQSLLLGAQIPSPNSCITQSLPGTLLQAMEQSQWQHSPPPPPPRPHSASADGSMPQLAPQWEDLTSAQFPPVGTSNPDDFFKFDVGFPQNNSFGELPQDNADSLQVDGLQDILSMSGNDGVFSLTNFDPSTLVSHPQGELELAMGPQVESYDFSNSLFTNFDVPSLEQQSMDLNPAANTIIPNTTDDLASLFQVPSNPEAQAFFSVQQRQPSMFTQDVMQFLNLEVEENALQDATVAPTSTVTPQQVRAPPHPHLHAQPMPIFTQVTNAPVASGMVQYVPPAGAMNSSNRRVAGSWKVPVAAAESPSEPRSPHPWDMAST
ncbi:hypothetical protein ID866_1070 [Astraeus odoratus]|nr:hypothetical protein ID866_1070 [Astraeus odoratus]